MRRRDPGVSIDRMTTNVLQRPLLLRLSSRWWWGAARASAATRPPTRRSRRQRRANADGSDPEHVTGEAFHDQMATWSPDGRGLVVSRVETPSGQLRLVRLDLVTGNVTPLTPPGLNAAYGSLSPDGRRLVLVCEGDDGTTDLCLANGDGGEMRPAAATPFEEFDPSWSPDGRRIAFSRYLDEGPHVLVMGAAGENERRVARGFTPAWSPGGETSS